MNIEPMTVERLVKRHGVWGEHPDAPVDDWKYEVDNGDTRQGYWEWVVSRLHAEEAGDN